jgi:hypothetical protein
LPFTSFASFAIRFASESKPRLAIPTNGRPFATPTSTTRSAPSTATRAASRGSFGIFSTRAKSFPRPLGTIASAPARPRSAPARQPTSPSPPTATTVSPSSAAAAASSRAWSTLRVSTTR